MPLTLIITIIAMVWTTGWLISQLIIYRHVISHKDSMLATMTLGMIAGLIIGSVLGLIFKNDFFTSSIYGMLIGILIGGISGIPTGLASSIEGMVSGLMGGMMGAMAGTMLPLHQGETLVKILFLLFMCLSLSLIYMIKHLYKKKEKSLLNHPKTFFIFLAFFLISYNQLGAIIPEIKAEEPEVIQTAAHLAKTITINATDYQFSPKVLHAKVGERVRLIIYNNGQEQHHFYIPDLSKRQLMIRPHMNQTLELTPTKKGSYFFYCTYPGHKARGMSGKIIVDQKN